MFQLTEVAVRRQMFQEILMLIADFGRRRHQRDREMRSDATADDGRGTP